MKVLVGISGGVDSSVCALILKSKGFDVFGVSMSLIDSSVNVDAKEVCNQLSIPFINLDYSKQFKKDVIDYFIDEYSNCRTPNPCVMCNKKLKFGYLYDYMLEKNYDYIATGHYAKIEYSDKYDRLVLKKSKSLLKDQSYFLYNLKPEMLSHILFPLSDYTSKDEIREIARNNNLSVASKSDSQDICFIETKDYKYFLENHGMKENIGNIVLNNKVIGKHTGLYKYTIGQRKGLGIAYSEPLFVTGFNKENNELIVGVKEDLLKNGFYVKNYNFIAIDSLDEKLKVKVKTRYKSIESDAYISLEDDLIKVEFINSQSGVTSGQAAVFYDDDIVIGGGIII